MKGMLTIETVPELTDLFPLLGGPSLGDHFILVILEELI